MYVPAVTMIWVAMPVFEILFAVLSSNIVDGVCVPYGVYSNVAAQKSLAFTLIFIVYLLPMTVMIFCYYRVVHALRTKVN